MKYSIIDDKLYIEAPLFSAEKVFDCGQSFRFKKVERNGIIGFEGMANNKFCRAEESENAIILSGIDTKDTDFWLNYFSLDKDYDEIKKEILSLSGNYSEFIDKTWQTGNGIRILTQDPWEAIASFIISQNNNIPRIIKIIDALSEMLGDKIENEYGTFYSFPSPLAFYNAGIEKIAESRCGFRAKYLYDAAEKVLSKEVELDLIPKLSTEEAIEYLCKIKGVGIKVASCALLFGFSKYDAFPIDVWMKKVIDKRFDSLMPDLGQYKGIAQQFLFYYERYIGEGS